MVYIEPSRRNWDFLGSDNPAVEDTTFHSRTITCERAGASESAVIGGIEALNPRLSHVTRPLAEVAVMQLGNFIREEKRRVAQDASPRFSYQVTLTVYAQIDTWPKVPGVTSSPWRPVLPIVELHLRDAENELLLGSGGSSLARAEHRVMRDGAWRVAWLAHPWTIEHVPPLLRDHFTFVSDVDIPRGVMRLAEEV